MDIATTDVEQKTSSVTIRGKIVALESAMKQLPQLEIPVKHYFADGLYLREIFIPKGTLMTGVVHKLESMDIVSYGMMAVINEKGEAGRIIAPCTIFSPPGIKKAGYALENTLWTSIHANPANERNIRILEEALFECTVEDLDRFEAARKRNLLTIKAFPC